MIKILFIVYDNASYVHTFPHGIAYLISFLRVNGFEVEVYNQDVYHYSDQHLYNFLKENYFDIVCLGIIGGYYQYKKLLSISKVINESNRHEWFILGGHGPSPDPEFFIKKTKADIIVRGEGEETLLEIVKTYPYYRKLKNIKGISYFYEGNVIHNPERELIENLDSLPFPDYVHFPIEYYKLYKMANSSSIDSVMPVITSRGCTFNCSFCYRMDKSYRIRNIENVIEEIEYLQYSWNITYINFYDELLMSSVSRTEELCNAIIESGLKFKWYCNGRLNYAKPHLLSLMKKSGCVYINYGVESLDNTVLKKMKKGLTENIIREGIKNTIDSGIDPGINIIFGNIGDSEETLHDSVEFMLENCPNSEMRTIRPVTPYPGSELFGEAVRRGLLKDVEDFYENKHINSDLLTVNFTELPDEEFYNLLLMANKTLIHNYMDQTVKNNDELLDDLYLNKNADFRGFRSV